MKIPISKLLNNTGQIEGVPTNPRTIDKADYQKLLKSIQEDPEYLDHEKPHVIAHGDKYVVLNGNQRLRALRELKFTETPVTIYKPDTPPEVIRARIIKSNHGYGKDDFDMLANDVWSDDPLCEWGMDLPDDWLQDEQEVIEDEAPEVDESEPPKSKLGEVYQLGRHFVMCGSATEQSNLDQLLSDAEIDMVFTDPPYGNSTSGKYGRGQLGVRTIESDENFTVTEQALTLLKDYPQLFFLQWRTFSEAYSYLASVGKTIKTIAVWDKKNAGLNGAGGMAEQWEAIIVSGDCKYKKFGGNVFRISREQKARVDSPHPHQKPIELLTDLFNFFEATTLIDPFLGSGSTLIACEQTDRTCYGMELDPKYVDVIRKRYWKFVNGGNEEGWENGTPAI